MKSHYLTESPDRKIFEEIRDYILKYNHLPSIAAIQLSISQRSDLNESEFLACDRILNTLNEMESGSDDNLDWMVDTAEKFCQEKAIYHAIMDSIQIIDGKDREHDKGAIPKILSDALGVSFDPHVGHDFIEQSDERFEYYHKIEHRIPFDLEYFNKITGGGIVRKSLTIILAGTGVGKSLAMCHFASANLMAGKNVLYVTMEMSEEKISERVDANLLNVTMDDLKSLPKETYDKRMESKVRSKTKGKLIVKEYPTAAAHTGHFRALLNDLKLKKNFIPDIIYVDYLNICASARIRAGANVNSYTYIKAIAEELRGLAVEFDVPVVSATQTTRSGFTNSDIGLEDTSESFGLPATADLMFALISTDELDALNQVLVKQLKNRYNNPTLNKRFTVGIDKAKMRLFDLDSSAQANIAQSGQSGNTSHGGSQPKVPTPQGPIGKFKGLKV